MMEMRVVSLKIYKQTRPGVDKVMTKAWFRSSN